MLGFRAKKVCHGDSDDDQALAVDKEGEIKEGDAAIGSYLLMCFFFVVSFT